MSLSGANPQPSHGPPRNMFDPFNTLPIDGRGNSHYLIGHYYTTFQPTNHPYSAIRSACSKEEFLSFAVSDRAVLHAALAHVAMTLCNLASVKSSPDLTYHVYQAIVSVNERIANPKNKTITKETIFAVACLASLELRSSSMLAVKTHIDGLAALIKIYGGVQALFDHQFTLSFAYWIDNLCSIAMNSKPRLKVAHSNPEPEFLDSCGLLCVRYRAKLSNLTGLHILGQETVQIFHILRYLITKVERVWDSQEMGTEAEFEALRSYTDQLMRRLIAFVQHKSPKSNDNALIFTLFGNAALAHVVMFTRNPPPQAAVPILMSTQIRACLETIDSKSFQIAYPEMMPWIIMMGGLASVDFENEGWFIKRLAECCRTIGIATTAELADFLGEFLWSKFYVGPIFQQFWENVALEQAIEAGSELGIVG